MKKVFGIISVATAIALLASCQKENLGNISPVSGEAVEFTVAIGDDTRTTIDEEFKTFWEKGDQLAVFDGTNTGIAVIPDSADGQASATISATGVSASAEAYTLVYPASDDLAISESGITAKFPTEQSGKFADAQFAVGYAGADKSVKMANISSVICFETADASVTSVEFAPLNDDDEFPTEATLTKVTGSKDQDSTAVDITNTAASIKVNASGAGKYYAAFFPFAQPVAGFKITVNTTDGSKVITAEVPVSFTAGKLVNLGNIDGREGKAYHSVKKVWTPADTTGVNALGKDSFSGNIDDMGLFTYTANKGNAGTKPAFYTAKVDGVDKTAVLRLYQAPANNFGGFITLASAQGDKIAGVKMSIGSNTTIAYAVDGEPVNIADSTQCTYSGGINITSLNASTVSIYCVSTSNNRRLQIGSIEIVYAADPRTPQILSFPEASYEATVGQTFTSPKVSGVQTAVTYSSSDDEVATVNATTGEVTIIGAGICTITANAAESDTYKPGTASYTLNVFASVQGIKGIKELIRAGEGAEVSFKTSVTDMIVTFARTEGYPFTAYLEESNGQAVYFYNTKANAFAAAGEKYNGTISGKGKVYNGACEITEINLSEATKSTGDVPLTTVTIAELNANYAAYEYRNIKIEGATATTALTATGSAEASCTIAQGEHTMTLFANKYVVATIDKGAVIDVVCHPDYYTNKEGVTTYQCYIWGQDAITVKGGANVITMDETHTMQVGQTWTIGATAAQGGNISYSIVSGSDCGSISGGVFTATKEGTAVIKATSEAVSGYTSGEATSTVTINKAGATTITLTFPDDNKENNKVNGYAETWTAKSSGYEFTLSGFNNYKWDSWTYIKCGQKKDQLPAGTIQTAAALTAKIASVTVTIDKFTSGKVKSFKLYVSSKADFSDAKEYSLTIATGDNKFTITNPAANQYYKIVIDCTGAGANGVVQLSKVVLSE